MPAATELLSAGWTRHFIERNKHGNIRMIPVGYTAVKVITLSTI